MSNLNVTLREITTTNWKTCIDLQVGDDQKGFVAPNNFSLVQAAYESDAEWTALAIYNDETMVGFLLYGKPKFPELGGAVWEICRLMVDQNHQKMGYGRAAMKEAIRRMSSQPDCDNIYIFFHPDNAVAQALYASLGFEHTGMILYEEVVMRLPVKR